MTKAFKKVLSLALCLMMLAGMCSAGSVTASAEDKSYTISLGQTVTVEIDAGGDAWVEFTPAITASYTFYSSSSDDTYCELYNSANSRLTSDDDGGDGNNFSITYFLKAGMTYRFRVRYYYSDDSGSFDVTLVEAGHIDGNFDGKCDICGYEFRVILTADVPITVTLSADEGKQIVFKCEKDGEYSFSYDSSSGGSFDYDSYIYDSNGNEVGEWYDYLTLTAGEVYSTSVCSYETSEVTITDVCVRHLHKDDDSDKKCDICSVEFSDTIAFGEEKTVAIPANDLRELRYTCQATGFYSFVYDTDTNGYDYSEVLDPDGDCLGYIGSDIYFVSGKTYRLQIFSDGETEIEGITLVKNHTDNNGDGKCDGCSADNCAEEFSGAIACGESVDLAIPAGETKELVFNCAKSGMYRVDYSSASGSCSYVIFSSTGKFNGEMNDSFFAAAGEKIIIRISSDNDTELLGLKLNDDHYDGDGDGKCDVCSLEFSASIALGEKKDVNIPAGEMRELVFRCEKDGEYYVSYNSGSGSWSFEGIYDSQGNYAGDYWYDLQLKADETYLIRFISDLEDATIEEIYVGHNHTDSNSDNKCDICGLQLAYDLILDTSVTVSIPSGESDIVVRINMAEDNYYKLLLSNDFRNFSYSVFNSNGNNVSGEHYYFESGETYTVCFSNSCSKDATGTVTLAHIHSIDPDSDKCGICGKQIVFEAGENKPVSVSVDPYDFAVVKFTPVKDGDYSLDYDSEYTGITEVTDSSGKSVPYGFDDFNGANYTLAPGETYFFNMYNVDNAEETFDVTVRHTHDGTVTTIVEPTIASSGLDKLTCSICGESVYALTDCTGGYDDTDGTTEDGFEYELYEKDGAYEAVIYGYTGEETEVVIPTEIEAYGITDPVPVTVVRSSDDSRMNNTVTSVTIPEGIREIGNSAFEGCTALKEIFIPESVLIIGDDAFSGCVNLEGVTLGSNVKYIGENAFATNPDEEEKEYFENYYSDLEERLADEIGGYEEDIAETKRDMDSYFAELSSISGLPVSSWDDVKAAVEAADLDDLNSLDFGSFADKEEATETLYVNRKSYYEGQIDYYNSQIRAAENLFDACGEIVSADDTPLAWVIYNGSEEDFEKIVIKKNNDELTKARRGVDGQDPEFTITYDANGGESAPEPQTGFKDVTLTTEEPEYYGYSFLGWATETDAAEAVYAAGDDYYLIADAAFYAVWEEIIVTLTYDANGGENAPAAQKGYGKIALAKSEPSRDGYEFLGWAKTKDATKADYAAGANYTLEEDTTLYAVWQKLYTLTYDANGGKDAPAAQKGNGEITLSSAKPARGGYEFLGWAKTKDATKADYAAGAKLNLTADTTVYAVWKATFKLPEFSAKSASYNTYVTVNVNLNNVPAGAEVYIDGKKADANGSTYSADIGQVKATKDVKIEVKQGGEVLDSATLTIKVDSGFFAKLISFFTNFLFNLFSWKKVTVTF